MTRPDGLDGREQEHVRVEYFGLDPDPRHVDEADEILQPAEGVWLGCLILATAILVGALFGAFVMAQIAAPRSASEPASDKASVQGPIGAPPSAPPPSLSAARSVAEQTDGAPSRSPAAFESPSPAITEPPAIEGGIASYCAPTPTQCLRWGGQAKLGAVHSFRFGDRPYRVKVCRQEGEPACVTVTIVSYCGCPDGRVIDLSPYAFRRLAPLWRGLVPVTVEELR